MKSVIIAGRSVELQPMEKQQLKGLTIGDSLSYRYFKGLFGGVDLMFAEPRGEVTSPRVLYATKANLEKIAGMPVIFILPECPAYLRQRLIDKDVYFVVSEKYAFTPTLLVNERERRQKKAKRLTPAAQYMLLYHLQVESLEGRSGRELESKLPYSYATIALAITCLDDLGLCAKVPDGTKSKLLHFDSKGKELWEKAQPHFINPVDQRIYCDKLLDDGKYPICGINALSHYTRLNPDPERMAAVSIKLFKEWMDGHIMIRANGYEGDILVESWKYPPVTSAGWQDDYIDKLSLTLTLREDDDPRVEGEVEFLIEQIEWKD